MKRFFAPKKEPSSLTEHLIKNEEGILLKKVKDGKKKAKGKAKKKGNDKKAKKAKKKRWKGKEPEKRIIKYSNIDTDRYYLISNPIIYNFLQPYYFDSLTGVSIKLSDKHCDNMDGIIVIIDRDKDQWKGEYYLNMLIINHIPIKIPVIVLDISQNPSLDFNTIHSIVNCPTDIPAGYIHVTDMRNEPMEISLTDPKTLIDTIFFQLFNY